MIGMGVTHTYLQISQNKKMKTIFAFCLLFFLCPIEKMENSIGITLEYSNCVTARFYENLANRELKYSGNKKLAILYFKKAFEICKSLDPEIWLEAANVTFETGDTITALNMIEEAALLGNKEWRPYDDLLIYINENEGILKHLKTKSDSVMVFYNKNYEFFDSIFKLDQKTRMVEKNKSVYSNEILTTDKNINETLIKYISERGFPKSSELSYEKLHHFFIIVFRHQMSG
jgi:tetratricopeptide (TPR) repeat protein